MTTATRFGVNYVPSTDWMFQWQSVEESAIRRDLEAIATLGLDHVRLFPLWPTLQPNRTLIRRRALDDVALVVDIAAEFGLDASVDVVQGHMSGFDFIPAWLVNWHDGNMFTDRPAIDAQAALVAAVYDAVRDRPNFTGLTLGNELNQFQPPNPAAMPADTAQVTHWLESLLGAPRDKDPRHVVTHSENDHLWYRDGHPFVPAHASRLGDVTTVHSWIFNGVAGRYGALSDESVRHAEWMIELARAFATDLDRPVWLQEVGAPDLHLAESEMPEFLERTVAAALTTERLHAVTWWCSHDVSRDLGDFKDLEYSLGLLDVDNRVKPLGRRYAEVVADARRSAPAPTPRTSAVVVDVDEADLPLRRTDLAPGGPVFEHWHRLRAAGEAVTVVTSRTAAEPAALAARGVTRVVETAAV
ncbi:cellulase (glycosyl hydrolase family 5) [Curtobacterium sp. JUb34]|uniref:glycoside hydrolase 5 family protein n=1 Tax=Curtobacterium sp. JUb34 TaxID=2485109 RepID=UPI000F4A12FF|nr:cellulase family glycosylhydrolase [Curtobacterium sp. JUb34]ROR35951.1 cellulase (glycosyl hydrolase family 5) [Curtobacterium sp. JUb34]